MGNYTNFGGFENPRRGGQARNLATNVPKILDLKSSSVPPRDISSIKVKCIPVPFLLLPLLPLPSEIENKAARTLKRAVLSSN